MIARMLKMWMTMFPVSRRLLVYHCIHCLLHYIAATAPAPTKKKRRTVVVDDSDEELNPSGSSHGYSKICTNIHTISARKRRENAPAVPGAESSDDEAITGAERLKNRSRDCDQFFEPPCRIPGKAEPVRACIKCS